jgi:hypothetical protein
MSTPRDTRLARLEFGTFYKVVGKSTFYEPTLIDSLLMRLLQMGLRMSPKLTAVRQ